VRGIEEREPPRPQEPSLLSLIPARAGAALLAVLVPGAAATLAAMPVPVRPGPVKPAPVTSAHQFYNEGGTHSPRLEAMLAGSGHADPAALRPPDKGAALGVDVASGQHAGGAAVDWPQVAAAGYRFAFIKATEGSYYANPYFAADVAGAKAAGLLVAGYHFANPAYSNGTFQADYALNDAGDSSDGQTLPFIADLEYDPYVASDHSNECYGLTPAQMVAWIRAFTTEVSRRTGQSPVIYTTADWWDKCTGSSTAFRADPLWIAYYPGKSGRQTPPLPAGWGSWDYWQFTSGGSVPGITGRTDVSELSLNALEAAAPADQGDGAGQPVSVPVNSVNALAGQALSYSATGLPPGLTIDATTGVITGTLPAAPASYLAAVTITGTGLPPVTENFTWNVHGAVTVVRPVPRSSLAGGPVQFQVLARDRLAGCTLRFAATSLPPGLTISPCGLIAGWLARPGRYQPVITVTDSSGLPLATTSLRWQVSLPRAGGPAGHLRLAGQAGCLGRLRSSLKVASCDPAGHRPAFADQWTVSQDQALRLAGRCLAVAGTTGNLALRPCRDSGFQQWPSGTAGTLVNVSTGECLTALPARATAAACTGAGSQQWRRPAGPLTSGVPGWCASDWQRAAAPPGPITARACGTGRATAWTLEPGGTLRSRDRCLAISYPAVAGAAVLAAPCTGLAGQRWQLGAGQVAGQLSNPKSGLCLVDPADPPATARLVLGYCDAADPAAYWRPS
jgi:GH25 family lysozyme M1 (1,4-beta-N-acetylmuramidase)